VRRSTLLTVSLSLSAMFGLAGCAQSSGETVRAGESSNASTSSSSHGFAISRIAASSPSWTSVGGPRVVAVGDIACAPGGTVTPTTCRQAATAKQARAYDPKKVLGLGDMQYESGSLSEFRGSYDKSWGGDLKAITKPIPGNHEYRTSGASGYYRYFRNQQPGGSGYYSFNVGSWRVYALNSNCTKIDCARENAWLERDMAANPKMCTALMMHHPLYSSGYEHGDSPEGRRFWSTVLNHDADLVLAGHDHNYERFQPMNADGQVTSSGMASFVVGAGGKNLYSTRGIREGSVVFDNHRAGVLAMHLGRGAYGWKYQTIDGQVMDQGTATCR
jgi:acid phosphatase type 7